MTYSDAYWRRTRRLTFVLLAFWLLLTFGLTWFARDVNEIVILGFPLGFYMAAQGAQIVYVLIIGYYARYMNRLDRTYDVYEREDER